MGVLFAPVPILHPGEGKIGKRFALVFNGQAAGFISFGKDDARPVQVNCRLRDAGATKQECC